MDGVREVYGRRSAFDVPARLNSDTGFSDTTDMISYDDFDLQCLKKDSALKRGSDLSKVLLLHMDKCKDVDLDRRRRFNYRRSNY